MPANKLLVRADGTGAQLYDLAADPGERADLAARRPAAADSLRRLVAAWAASLPAAPSPDAVSRPAPNAVPNAAAGTAPGGAAGDTAWRVAGGRLRTRWAADVRPDAVLPEYPRPQLTRARWQSLNGLWQFALLGPSASTVQAAPAAGSNERSGLPNAAPVASQPGGAGPAGPLPLPNGDAFAGRILVPFAPEAALSGVGRHADRVAYRRTFRRPAGMAAGERLLLHVGACDWHCTVYLNGRMVEDHTGGYDAFSVDVTDALRPGGAEQELTVVAYDPTDRFGQPRGKQVSSPEGIWYTPVTGLWQTVWLEPVPAVRVASLRLTPDVPGGALRVTARGRGALGGGLRVRAVALAGGRVVGRAEEVLGAGGAAELRVPVPRARLWSPADPFLYGLAVTLVDGGGRTVDSVGSYFGMRSVGLARDARGVTRLALNGRPVFHYGPLDQGWWPDGLYTAPTDAALRSDLELTKALGFTMSRKHIKVEPARWYYWADRLGLMVWQDMPSGWNDGAESRAHFERELRLMLDDLHNHPSVVAWVPFNEKWGQWSDTSTRHVATLVRRLDPSRLVNDASGWQHSGAGDMVDVHRYQGPQAMRAPAGRASVVGEFGGLGYQVAGRTWAGDAWGYGGLFASGDSLRARYELLVKRLYRDRDTHGVAAGVYTQLTDVEAELNGFATYDRAALKFDTARTAAVNRGGAPYLLPEEPEFTDRVRVAVHQGAPGEVRYTLDGSAPNVASPVYRGPLTLAQTTTVRARAFAGGRPTAAPEARVDYRRVAGRAPLAAAEAARLAPGLRYQLYRDTTPEPAFRMRWPVRWQVDRREPFDTGRGGLRPAREGVARRVDPSVSDAAEMFSVRYQGYVRVPRAGVYTFTALADDGAALWVDGRRLFSSLGQSPATTESSGRVALRAGAHPLTLGYFQAYGPRALTLLVEGPGVPRQPVPAAWLLHDAAASANR